MTIRALLTALRARWYIVLIGTVVGLVLALALSLLSHARYVANAAVLVSVESPETVENQNVINPPELAAGYLETQSDIIRSDRTIDRVVKLLGTNGEKAVSSLADQLRSGLILTTAYPSRVIGIGYASTDPTNAAKVANAFAAAYQSVSLDLQLTPAQRSLAWYDKATRIMSARLADAGKRLAAAERLHGVTSAKDGIDAEERRLDTLSQALGTAQASQAAASARTGGGAMPDALLSPVVQRLQSDIAQFEGQRRELAVRAGPNNAEMRELDGKLAGLRGELARQKGSVSASARIGAQQAARSVGQLAADVTRQKLRVINARTQRGEVDALQQEVNAISRSYDALVERQTKANLLGSGEQTNVTVLSRAIAPARPSGLPLPTKLIAGVILGTLLGLMAAIAVELQDSRIRSIDEGERALGIPSLGWIRPVPENDGGASRLSRITSWHWP